MIDTLFIGGPADGRIIPADPRASEWMIPEAKRRPIPSFRDVVREGKSLIDDAVTLHAYRLERIRAGRSTFRMFIHSDVSLDKAIALLLDRYSGGRLYG